MKVLGLLQNTWARDPKRVHEMLGRHDNDRRHMVALLLFQSYSGKRIKAAFGDLTRRIEWENISRRITGKPRECPPIDWGHMAETLREVKPRFVLAFGHKACCAVYELCHQDQRICGPHPAARSLDIPDRLIAMRNALVAKTGWK